MTMMKETLKIGNEPINLTQVLKLAGWADNGGHAKSLISDGQIRVNGEIELRKRRKMTIGDTVELVGGQSLILARSEDQP